MATLGKRFHVKFLGYAYWFMSIMISQLRDYYISVDQAIYATSFVKKYLENDTIKEVSKFHNTTLPHDMIFTKECASTSYDQVKVLYREYNIQYIYCVEYLIYLLSTRVDKSFAENNLELFSSSPGKVHYESLVHFLRYIRENKNWA